MLANIDSDIYDYFRGAIFILSLYHLLMFLVNNRKQFLFYGLYFLFLFFFFFGQGLEAGKMQNLFIRLSPSIHFATYVFYIAFARSLLNTADSIPKWDNVLQFAQKILIAMIGLNLVLLALFGHSAQVTVFMIMSPLFSIFALVSYYRFLQLRTTLVRYFVFGSLLFFIFANLSFLAQILYGFEGFNTQYGIHPSFFFYVGTLLEALVFAGLLGSSIKKLQMENDNSIDQLNKLKLIVSKDHIVLKDKSKVFLSELVYIKSDDHYINIFSLDGKKQFVRGKLSQVKLELPPNFIQSHRSYIVNSNFIKQTSYSTIILKNGTRIPISRTYSKAFKERKLN